MYLLPGNFRKGNGYTLSGIRASKFSLGFFPPLVEQHVDGKEEDADADGRIGHVEGRPVVLVPVEIEEVDHLAQPDPVDKIAECAGEDKGESDGVESLIRPKLAEYEEDHDNGDNRDADEEGEAETGIGQKAERRPLVADIGNIDEVFHNCDGGVEPHGPVDKDLGCLVEEEDDSGDGA